MGLDGVSRYGDSDEVQVPLRPGQLCDQPHGGSAGLAHVPRVEYQQYTPSLWNVMY